MTRLLRGEDFRPPAFLLHVLILLLAATGCGDPQITGGNVHLDEGRVEEAEARYREALSRDPNNPEAHFQLARVLAMRNEANEAALHFTRAEELSRGFRGRVQAEREKFAAQYQERALSLLREMRPAEAVGALEAAETLDPGRPHTAYLRGRVEAVQSGPEGAVVHYRRAHVADPRNTDYTRSLTETLVELGRRSKESRDHAAAVAYLEEAITVADRSDIHYLLGSVYYTWAQSTAGDAQMRHLQRAADAFTMVLRRNPGDQDASYNLAAVLLASRRYDEAVDLYRRLLAEHPRDGELYLALALAHGHLGQSRLAMAEEAVGRALQAGQPVTDPGSWARRSAERFPHSDLAALYRELDAPREVLTYQRVGGGLMEVWLYWGRGVAEAFREGGRHGDRVPLPR
jgi:tetratricopeptide (TPR) repeat protein